MSRVDGLNRVLKWLLSESTEVAVAALVSEDGLVIASAIRDGSDELQVAGISAAILSLGAKAASELGRGKLEQIIIAGQDGYLVLAAGPAGTLLLVLTTKEAKLGLTLLDMRKASGEIGTIL